MGQGLVENQSVRSVIVTTRIIVFSLLMGVLVFATFVILNPAAPVGIRKQPTLTYMAAAMSALSVVASFFVPSAIARAQCAAIAAGRFAQGHSLKRPQNRSGIDFGSDEGQVAAVYQTKTIIACALLEAPAFFALFAYWQEQQMLALALVATLLLLLAARFPIAGNVEQWIEHRLRDVQQQRQQQRQQGA